MSIDIYSTDAMEEDINEFSSSKVATENKEKSKYTIKTFIIYNNILNKLCLL